MGYIVLAVSYRMDWLDTCRSTGRMLLTKLPVGTGWSCTTIVSRGLNKWASIPNACQTLLPRKAFSNYCIHPQSTGGTANVGTAVLEYLHSQLFADQHLQEELNTSLTRQTQSSCCIYQIGSGSFSYKLENKVNSSTFPKFNSIPDCNTDMIILLSLCAVHLKHLVQWEPWCRSGPRWNGQASSTPFPFLLFGNYWYARYIFYKP